MPFTEGQKKISRWVSAPVEKLRTFGQVSMPAGDQSDMGAQVAKAYLLTIELHGPHGKKLPCVLPCLERDMTLWLAASQRTDHAFGLTNLIRNNPTLFLMAVSRAIDCSGQKIQSMVHLLKRLDHCFNQTNSLDSVLGHVSQVETTSRDSLTDIQIQAAVAEFKKSKKPKKLAKSLTKFIRISNRRHLCKPKRTPKSCTRDFIRSLLDDSFRVEVATGSPSACSVTPDQSTSVAIKSLLRERQQIRHEFDSRLLNAKLSAMKQLAYGASHEINNPLANIATRAQTLLSNETDPDRRFQLAVMHEQAMRAHDMISDMMLFAHPPKLVQKIVDVRLMLSHVVRDCTTTLGPLVRSNTRLYASISNDVSVASIDQTHCRVALESLIQNAAEAIRHDHGEINIHVSRTSKDIVFTISDNGTASKNTQKTTSSTPSFLVAKLDVGLDLDFPSRGESLGFTADRSRIVSMKKISLRCSNSEYLIDAKWISRFGASHGF